MVMGINFGVKKSEKALKDINSQLESVMMITNVSAGTVPDIRTEHPSGPLSAIALAAGRLFKPTNKEIDAIDEQLSSIIDESEGILKENGRPAKPPAAQEPVILESVKVEKVSDYKEALPQVSGPAADPEMKEMIDDVKQFAVTYKNGASLAAAAMPEEPTPADDMKAAMDMLAQMRMKSGSVLESKPKPEVKAEPKDPLALDMDLMAKIKESENMMMQPPIIEQKADKNDPLALDGDFLAKLRQSTAVDSVAASAGPDIRRDLRDLKVTCVDLESEVAQIAFAFRSAPAPVRSGRKR